MKKLFYLLLILAFAGCEDNYEDTYRYAKIITQTKNYPVYLDMTNINNIQAVENSPVEAPFKIVSDNNYYYVGDMLKGVHVYEKTASGASYLSFIECMYIKDFEVVDNLLYCNNLIDMVVVDVSNPQQINIADRKENHFNRFTSYAEYWNIPYEEGKGIIVSSQSHSLTGVVTNEQPDLDFTEYDRQFDNLTTPDVPDSWFSNPPAFSKPYVGIVNPGTGEIHTFGKYNSWAIGTFHSGTLSVKEENLWTPDRGNYAPPYYYSNAFPFRMFFEDDIIFVLGAENNRISGYSDCILYDAMYPVTHHLYFPEFIPLDICYMPHLKTFYVLSGTSVWGVVVSGDGVSGYEKVYKDFEIDTNATEIIRVGESILTIGDKLSVYATSKEGLLLLKEYPGISGTIGKTEGTVLSIAGTDGLTLYDISDLENIIRIP